MKEAKFTPGPWVAGACCDTHVEQSGWGWFSVSGPQRGGAGGHQFRPEDARLIAAAPELYAALSAYVNDDGELSERERKNLARAALAKAVRP